MVKTKEKIIEFVAETEEVKLEWQQVRQFARVIHTCVPKIL